MTGDDYRGDTFGRYAGSGRGEPGNPVFGKPEAGTMGDALIRRLGEAGYGEEAGRVGFLNLLARSGASVSEGVVLTRESHRRFLETGGVAEAIRGSAYARGDLRRRIRALRRRYGRAAIEGELNRMICEAIIDLGARTVVVISEDVTRAGLRTLPEVRDAVRKAWLSVNGLKRQIEAASRGEELPTWPVLVQRETREGPRGEGYKGSGA